MSRGGMGYCIPIMSLQSSSKVLMRISSARSAMFFSGSFTIGDTYYRQGPSYVIVLFFISLKVALQNSAPVFYTIAVPIFLAMLLQLRMSLQAIELFYNLKQIAGLDCCVAVRKLLPPHCHLDVHPYLTGVMEVLLFFLSRELSDSVLSFTVILTLLPSGKYWVKLLFVTSQTRVSVPEGTERLYEVLLFISIETKISFCAVVM